MMKYIFACLLILAPHLAKAQNDGYTEAQSLNAYTSFIVEIPYEISLPPQFRHARMFCNLADRKAGKMLFTRAYHIELVSGTASGVKKFGYGPGTDDDAFAPLSDSQTKALRKAVLASDFELNLDCFLGPFNAAPGGDHMVGSSDINYALVQRLSCLGSHCQTTSGPFPISSVPGAHAFNIVITAQDNAPNREGEFVSAPKQNAATSALTGTLETMGDLTTGVKQLPRPKGLSAILEGK